MNVETPLGSSLRTLGQLLGQNHSLIDALERSAAICGRSKLRFAWLRISHHVRAGLSFQEAIQSESSLPADTKNLINLAFESGNASRVLIALAAHHDAKTNIQRVLINQVGPLLTVLLTTILFGALWSFHIAHNIRAAYIDLGVETPFYLSAFWSLIWIIPSLTASVYIYRYFYGRGSIRSSSISRLLDISTSLDGLSVFISAGMPLHRAMQATSFKGFSQAASVLERGEPLSPALAVQCPQSLAQILADANSTGQLASVCQRLSRFYKQLAFARLRVIASRFIPFLLIACSLVTGFAVFSGYFAYFDTVNSIIGALVR